MLYLSGYSNDKNALLLECSAKLSLTILENLADNETDNEEFRKTVEKTGVKECLLNKILKCGLEDASPKVREISRKIYWLIGDHAGELFLERFKLTF